MLALAKLESLADSADYTYEVDWWGVVSIPIRVVAVAYPNPFGNPLYAC